MRWGRPIKTHPHRGGGYPTLEDFCAIYGLKLTFCLLVDRLVLVHPSVCMYFVFYNVRAYMCVRLNVNSS